MRSWSAGLFGEVGAAYRVTSGLSLGGTATISGGYLRNKQKGAGTTYEASGFYVQGIRVLLAVGIYF